MSDENIGDKDVRRKSNPTSSDRKKKLHRLLASSSSSSSEEFERQSHTVEEGHDYITYDVENNFTQFIHYDVIDQSRPSIAFKCL